MAPGFDRGFDFFDAGFHPKRSANESRYDSVERRAGDVVGHAMRWMAKNQNPQKPFFVWIHLYDPHAPYDPPAPFDNTSPISTTEKLPTPMRPWENSLPTCGNTDCMTAALITMMSDHGESLGAHGESMHGIFLYDEHPCTAAFQATGRTVGGPSYRHPGAAGGRGSHAS